MSEDHTSDTYTKDEKSNAKQALEKVTTQFLDQLYNDEKNYDVSTTWIDISIVKSSEVRDLRTDETEWGDYIPDIESDSDYEDEDAETAPTTHKLSLRSVPQAGSPISAEGARSKLRPASDVLSRLRWDPQLSPSDYIVGYEDRFLGAQEMSLEKWKSESTDDEFVPLHRVLYFKKRIDGDVVWDRRSRIDKVFGSGVGDAEWGSS